MNFFNPSTYSCAQRDGARVVFLALTAGLLGALPLSAANGVWLHTDGGTKNWVDAANWTGGTIPGGLGTTTNADQATFGTAAGANVITIDAGRNLRTLIFNGTNAAGLYTLGSAGANTGEALHLSSGGNITVSAGTQTVTTINAPLVLEAASASTAGSYTITNNATADNADPNNFRININGNISGGTTSSTVTLNLTGTAGNRNSNTSANVISGLISNGGAQGGLILNVVGAGGGNQGAWSLINDNNSYTGATTVTNGTLLFSSIANAGQNSALGAGSALTIASGGHAKYTGGAASTDRLITGNNGSFYNHGTGAMTLTGGIHLQGALTFRGSQHFIVDSVITGGGDLRRTDSGTVFLNQINTFTGNISISDGAFRIASIADKGVVSPIGAGSTISLGQNSGTIGRLEFEGPNGGSSDRDIRLSNGNGSNSGNGRIDSRVAGKTLFLSGTVRSTSSDATHVSSLNLTGVGDGVMAGIIGGTNSSASATIALQLTKNGSGTWALSAPNNYSRGTLISAGTLLATNSFGSATGTGNVITSGTGTLGGTGFITGGAGSEITIATGTNLMIGNTHLTAAGTIGNAGYFGEQSTLTLGTNANVAITLAGRLQFDIFTNEGTTLGQADLLRLNTTASSLTLGGIISLGDSSGQASTWRSGTWQLIDWAGVGSATKNGNFTFELTGGASLPSGYGFVSDTFLTDGIVSIAKVAANQTWTNPAGGSWGDAANWDSNALPSSSTDVFFLNQASGSGVITASINGDRNVKNLYFSGERNYVIGGGGGVLFSHGNLLQVEAGTQGFDAQLRISTSNSPNFTIYNDGTLNFGSYTDGNLTSGSGIMYHRQGSGPVNVINLVFDGSGVTNVPHFQRRYDTFDMNIVKNGSGTLILHNYIANPAIDAAGYITGSTTINAGKLSILDERSLGGDPASFAAGHLTINGGTLVARDTFTMDDANRGITVGDNGGTIEVAATKTMTVANAITGDGDLIKTGTGALAINSADNTHTGSTEVREGTLQVGAGGFTGTGLMTVSYGAQLVGTGTIQASAFALLEGAGLRGGDLVSGFNTGNGTLTFDSGSSAGYWEFTTSSGIELSITAATNQSVLDPTFGGNEPGTPGFASYVAGVTGAGDHDRLVFQGAAGSYASFSGNLSVVGVGLSVQPGQIFNLIDWTTLVDVDFSGFDVGDNRDGSGDNLAQFDLPDISSSGYYWDVSQFFNTGSIVVVGVIPEPGRFLLLVAGLSLLGLRRRRR